MGSPSQPEDSLPAGRVEVDGVTALEPVGREGEADRRGGVSCRHQWA